MLNGRVALVTGGATGIGEAAAQRVVELGGAAVIMARSAALLDSVAARLGEKCVAIAGDAGAAADVRAAVDAARDRFGRLDAVIASPGMLDPGRVGDIDDARWRALVYGNLDTAFVTARECLPALIETRGSITFVSSVAGIASIAQNCGYVTAKHAVIGLMRSICQDYGRDGVRANAVCPGWVKTPMSARGMEPLMARQGISLDQAYDHVAADTPLGRASTPAEIASICAFLSSDDASFVTGAVIVADGGGDAIAAGALNY